ncbi:MAG: DUF4013 domain-containing protein [Candidatus Promineofilum sp.]|nr:DUF4013 domain-containing protein [Promineifilum sp.]MCW5862178.1 DUF4013 domain-containing protein [Anaerolineae bacterium]
MDVNKAVRFVFEDKQWISKLLIAILMSLLAFVIVPALILQGYVVKLIRQVMNGNRDTLPEWDDWGKLLRDGFFVTVGELAWMLPLILLVIIVSVATGGIGSLSEDAAAVAATGGGLLLLCLVLLMVLVALFLTPALLIQYAIKDDFGALFRFSEVFDIIRNHMSDILIAFLVTVAAVFVVSLIGGVLGIIPCLGWIAAFVIGLASGPYVSFVGGHLYGQIAAKVLGNKAGNYYPPTA